MDVLDDKKATTAAKTAALTTINAYNAAGYKSTNDLILEAADYYSNDLIPSEDKAAALAKIFGKTGRSSSRCSRRAVTASIRWSSQPPTWGRPLLPRTCRRSRR